jgi:hypothetical protein
MPEFMIGTRIHIIMKKMMTRGALKNFSYKKLVILAWLCFVSALVSSYAYVAEYADHECEGEDCHVCLQIANVQNGLQKLSLGVIPITSVCLLFFASTQRTLTERANCVKRTNPVSLKVRLNN